VHRSEVVGPVGVLGHTNAIVDPGVLPSAKSQLSTHHMPAPVHQEHRVIHEPASLASEEQRRTDDLVAVSRAT
jgi:hypothetical protein